MGGEKAAPTDWGNAWRCRGLLLLTVGRTYALHRFGLWPRAAFSSGIFVSARVITGGRKERAKDGRGGGEGAARPLPPAMAFKNTGKKPLGAAGTNPLLRGRAEKKDPPAINRGGI